MPEKKYFMSYARQDQVLVEKIVNALREHNIQAWLDMIDIPIGVDWDDEIQHSLKTSDAIVFFASPVSVASKNVKNELSYADELNKGILPVIIEDCELPFRYKRKQFVDLTQDYEKGLAKLIKVLGGQSLPLAETTTSLPKTEASHTEIKPEIVAEAQPQSSKISPAPEPTDPLPPWEFSPANNKTKVVTSRNMLIGVVGIIAVFLGAYFFLRKTPSKSEVGAFNIDTLGPAVHSTQQDPGKKTASEQGETQIKIPPTGITEETPVSSKVETEAKFPGGAGAWSKYISGEINRHVDELTLAGKSGTCVVQFIVDKEGNISNVEALNMKGTRFAEICVNALKKSPNWVPAEMNGRKVKAYRKQPITFKIPGEQLAKPDTRAS